VQSRRCVQPSVCSCVRAFVRAVASCVRKRGRVAPSRKACTWVHKSAAAVKAGAAAAHGSWRSSGSHARGWDRRARVCEEGLCVFEADPRDDSRETCWG
jgi:hypothetical protein